jgi:hypothetical protein
MLGISGLLLLLFYSHTLLSQDKLSLYKLKVDSVIKKTMDLAVVEKLTLVDLLISPEDSSRTRFINFKLNKDKKIAFLTATFFFEFYEATMDYSFRFPVIIDRNKNVIDEAAIFNYLPVCVVKKAACNFISKDSALKIAIRDSILFTDNLSITLFQEHKKDIFFWLVTGKPKAKDNNAAVADKPVNRQRRLINAKTGQIITR